MQSSELEFGFSNENEEDYKMITGNNKFEISDTILKLEELLDQGQFELMSDQVIDGKLKAVYLMNDAVESFLVFEQARITGVYQKEYEGEVEASLSIHKNPDTEKEEFVLVVYQGDTVCTLFFADIVLETHLYDYGKVGHFWVEGYEYLRQLEYRLAILRDKRDYLGEVYCNEAELKLAHLAEFPPTPLHAGNVNSHVLFGMTGRDVVTTVANGKVLMKDRELLNIDAEKVLADCRQAAGALADRINSR